MSSCCSCRPLLLLIPAILLLLIPAKLLTEGMDNVAAYGEILDVPVMDVEAILSKILQNFNKRGSFFSAFSVKLWVML